MKNLNVRNLGNSQQALDFCEKEEVRPALAVESRVMCGGEDKENISTRFFSVSVYRVPELGYVQWRRKRNRLQDTSFELFNHCGCKDF